MRAADPFVTAGRHPATDSRSELDAGPKPEFEKLVEREALLVKMKTALHVGPKLRPHAFCDRI